MYVCTVMYACMYVRTYVHMYVCVYTDTHVVYFQSSYVHPTQHGTTNF